VTHAVEAPASRAARWRELGTTVRVVVDDAADLAAAAYATGRVLDDVDRACSRFREDSELRALSRSGGRPVPVSPLLFTALEAALRAARLTGGAVDPTGGASIRAMGYDRDFAELPARLDLAASTIAFPGWRLVHLDPEARTVRLPGGVELDLGATAKGLAADLAAASASAAIHGRGVLVSLGGDIAVAGDAPSGGWPVLVAEDHRVDLDAAGPRIALRDGGLATSSVTVRTWRTGTGAAHHLLDPVSGAPIESPWRSVSVAASSCLDANIASTAAILLGRDAPRWLEARGLPARLVASTGAVHLTGAWPRASEAPR
jgi:thiamine biosynthesis lipoprotein